MGKWTWRFGMAVFIALLHTSVMWAAEPLLIVTDPWPPYTIDDNGTATGIDVEITQAVFQQLGVDVNIVFYPWKRCLVMVKYKEADAILSASITPERKEFLCFPEEPTSEGITVFFIKEGRKIPFKTLNDLRGLRIGVITGYSYCEELDQAPFIQHAEPVASLTQNFKKLLADRLDVVIEGDKVGYFTAKEMGILDQIDVIPNAAYCYGGNYLAFSKKPGGEKLSSRFSKALKAFKTTDAYKNILKKYGINGASWLMQ